MTILRLGLMGQRILTIKNIEIWRKQMSDDRVAFVFYNRMPFGTPDRLKISLKKLKLTKFKAYNFFESFTGKFILRLKSSGVFKAIVEPSGSVFAFWTVPVSKKKNNNKIITNQNTSKQGSEYNSTIIYLM